MLPASHPLRTPLNNEAHARLSAWVATPSRLTSFALYFGADKQGQCQAFQELAHRLGLPDVEAGMSHYLGEINGLTVRWALHNEFARYTFITAGADDEPFSQSPLDALPADWLAQLPGQLLVGIHALLLPAAYEAAVPDIARRYFAGNELIGAEIAEGNGVAYTDLRLHPDAHSAEGFSRLIVLDRNMGPRQSGRMLQRLIEIEVYRMLALLALPIAKRHIQETNLLDARLRHVIARMAAPAEPGSDAELLAELTDLATAVEQLVGEQQFRYSASRAYYQLVEQRIVALRERRIPGLQPFREFMEKRLAPAMTTCATATGRQERLIERVHHTTALLRTRVEVQNEAQNRALLASMDRRAALQLRLQETVEGLSVGVLTYYAIGLLGYGLKGLKAAGLHLNVELLTGLAILPIAAAVWYGMHRIKRAIGH